MSVVVTVRPRFVVEVGEAFEAGPWSAPALAAEEAGVPVPVRVSWSFNCAFDDLNEAVSMARLAAGSNEHVRVVDREPEAAPVGVPDGAEGCTECVRGEGVPPTVRVLLDGCACGRIGGRRDELTGGESDG